MIKEIVKAKEGYEKVVEVFDELICNIEEAKAEEIAQIEQKYADRLERYNSDKANYVETIYEEIPDEEETTEVTDDSLDELDEMGASASCEFQTE
jgi:hypothetical protein